MITTIAAATLIALGAQAQSQAQTDTQIPPIIDPTAIQTDTDPCANFYQYACGAWLERTKVPPEKKSVSRQVTAASDATDLILNKILVAYARGDFSTPSKYAGKLSDYYNSCLNADQQATQSLAAVKRQITKIRAAKSKSQRAELAANLSLMGAQPFFGFGSFQDPADSTKVIGYVYQAGMGLGSKAYYFDQDEKSRETRAKYEAYIAKLFSLLGEPNAERTAKRVLNLETAFAKGAYTIEERNDPTKTNHPASQETLKKHAPGFDWATYFRALGMDGFNDLNIEAPEYLEGQDEVLARTSAEDNANYLVYRFVDAAASKMGGEFEKAHFAFWETYMNGTKAMQPRWKHCTQETAKALGYPLAEAYIQTFDGKAIREKTALMIEQIKTAFVDNLAELNRGPEAWIDDETLKGANAKVGAVAQKVGGPEVWRNYDSVKTSATNFLRNALAVGQYESRRDLAKIGKPVDRSEWSMMPWEVNAYYERSNNEFVFPFGILQPPSLDLAASDGANFGSFGGGTIGHELLHGFDKNGAKYDARGNLKDWWSQSTSEQFEKRAQCFIEQGNAYRIEEVGLNVNGAQTIDENLSDQGGVKLGYKALEKILEKRAETPPWHGYSERQQFWIGYAQSWCTKWTPERLRQALLTGVHPPAEFRVNAVMMNRPEFARDFNCKAGTRMAPVKRCSIW